MTEDILGQITLLEKYKVALVLIRDFYNEFNDDIQRGIVKVNDIQEKMIIICKLQVNVKDTTPLTLEEQVAKQKLITYIDELQPVVNRLLNMKAFW